MQEFAQPNAQKATTRPHNTPVDYVTRHVMGVKLDQVAPVSSVPQAT
jgi:hypothetical protein